MSVERKNEAPPVDQKKNEKGGDQAKAKSTSPPGGQFSLETSFPDVSSLLAPYSPPSLDAQNGVVIALDTSALCLPFELSSGNLKNLEDVYRQLKSENRLVVPGRSLREFLRLRDKKLGDLISALNKQKSNQPYDLPSKLIGKELLGDAEKKISGLKNAKKEYDALIGKIVDTNRGWRGNDPVTSIYFGLFDKEVVEDIDYSEKSKTDLLAEMRTRYSASIPPGFKDKGKDDEGIGDFLIWKTLLSVGEKRKCDLAFVTGEEKGDWWTRVDKEGVFPRVELVHEYRSASGGKNLRLMSLHELLKELHVDKDTVTEVEKVEQAANNEIRISEGLRISEGFGLNKIQGNSGTAIVTVRPGDAQPILGLPTLNIPNAGLFVERDESGSGVNLLCNSPSSLKNLGSFSPGVKSGKWFGVKGLDRVAVNDQDVVIATFAGGVGLRVRFELCVDFRDLANDMVIIKWAYVDRYRLTTDLP